MLSRRQLLTGSAATAALLATMPAGAALAAPRRLPDDVFTLGVASGDPEPDSVVLWTRLAPDPLDGGGMPARRFRVEREVAEDEGFRRVVRRGSEIAGPELGHSVHAEPRGLRPAGHLRAGGQPAHPVLRRAFRGYVRCDVTPERWTSTFRVVDTVLTPGADPHPGGVRGGERAAGGAAGVIATVGAVTRSRTIVFDLGGVLVPSSRVIPLLAAELEVSEEAFTAAYWTGRIEFDLGGSTTGYWTAVVEGVGREPEPGLLERLARIDAEKWSDLPDASADLLAALRDERLAVLSNAPAPLAAAVRAAEWSSAMDALVFSAEVALMKPDPAIYARADELLGTAPGAAVFFDDKPENVEAARAHGWEAHVWEGTDAAREVLGRAGG